MEDVKKNGSGKSYLIQHSAGSGKSNSIAWLAHRLTGLHDYEDNKIFQSVIIVTDRRVLDSQLQSTVYQFDHVEGVVKKVDKNSGQLRDAINDGVGIIITTLQKFPVIYKEVDSAKKRFAIIIDEAHSSQTGDAAKKLKRALADIDMADELIRKRERSLKGAARAKLSRTKEFDHSKWVGGGMLDYRFSNARRIVNDIYAGEVSADV